MTVLDARSGRHDFDGIADCNRGPRMTFARRVELMMGGAKGNRTPDLLDANETRYQLRYSP